MTNKFPRTLSITLLVIALAIGASFSPRESYAQFIDRIVRGCTSGAVTQASVIVNPSGNGNINATPCTGGSFTINGVPVVPGTPAPVNATYITQTPNATLTNEQALSLLATGILKSTTGTGLISIAVAGVDYQPAGNYITALTGDGTAAGPGSVPFTLANVIAASSCTACNLTYDAKGRLLVAASGSFAPTSRAINTTAPLGGGGDLSADRTLTCTTCATTTNGGALSATSPMSISAGGLITIANAAADGATKGAASFTAADFDASSGNISIDYTNGQKATAGQPGFLTAADWSTFNGKQAAGNYITALTGDGTAAGPGSVPFTLANVIAAGGPTGSATVAPTITYDAKGRLTTVTSATITPAVGSITGLGTGIATALGINVGTAGAPVVNGGALGTPSSGTVTNLTGTAAITVSTAAQPNITSLGTLTSLAASGNITSSAGNGGFGTASPNLTSKTRAVTLNGSADAILEFAVGGTLKDYIYGDASHLEVSGQAGYVSFIAGSAEQVRFAANGSVTMPGLGSSSAATTGTVCWTSGTGLLNVDTTTTCLLSGEQFKEYARNYDLGLNAVMQLHPRAYFLKPEYNATGLGEQVGFFAGEVAKVDSRLVSFEADGTPHAVRYQQMSALFASAIQELNAKVDAQQKEIEELRRKGK